MGRFAAVAAVALLLGGLAAVPVGAQTRSQAVDQANRFIDWCFAKGGNPHVWSAGGELIEISCDFSDGSSLDCQFYPEVSCTRFGSGMVPNPSDGIASPLVRPKGNHGMAGATLPLGFDDGAGNTHGQTGNGAGKLAAAAPTHPAPHAHHKGKHGKK